MDTWIWVAIYIAIGLPFGRWAYRDSRRSLTTRNDSMANGCVTVLVWPLVAVVSFIWFVFTWRNDG